MAAFGLVLLGVLSMLAVLVPPVVGPTPVEGIEITRPLWSWWFFPMEEWFGVEAIGWVILDAFGLIFLVPFLDRSPRRGWPCPNLSRILSAENVENGTSSARPAARSGGGIHRYHTLPPFGKCTPAVLR